MFRLCPHLDFQRFAAGQADFCIGFMAGFEKEACCIGDGCSVQMDTVIAGFCGEQSGVCPD
jgi:hypothetical protein